MPKLPREIEVDPRRPALEAALGDARPLWAGGDLPVARVGWSSHLARALRAAAEARRVHRGLEGAADALAAEQRGLDALRERQGPVDRTSRLLVLADDGSERFYRTAERLLQKYGDRLLGLRIAVAPDALGSALYETGAVAKALLVSDRASVTAVLRSLAPESAEG